MLRHTPAALFSVAIAALLTCTPTSRFPGLTMTVTTSDYKFHTPADIYSIMDRSNITYKIRKVDKLTPFNLVQNSPNSYSISPYHRIMIESGSNFSIVIEEPEGRIAELYRQAVQQLKKQNYDSVKVLYEEALRLDSTYFKTWTNLGDVYYLLEDYVQAEKYLKKSLEMNEIGYQEYFFLADVYDKMGKRDEAIDAIAHAYMLNKNSTYVQRGLYNILEKNGLQLRSDRLQFPFQIRRTGVTECEIQFRNKDGFHWMAMANCMACWEMEPDFHERLQSDSTSWSAKVDMYKECLFNQGVFMENKRNAGDTLSKNEQLLREALFARYINPIVYWEILSGEIPQAVLLLPQQEKKNIVRYIKKYVFEKKD
jgi:hypothetical protein